MTLTLRAQRATIYAAGARARHQRSREKRQKAVKLTALAIVYELRAMGRHVPRRIEQALRGNT